MGGRRASGLRGPRCGGSREPGARGERGERTAAGPSGPPAWAERRACGGWRAPCLPAWWTAAPGKSRSAEHLPRGPPSLACARVLATPEQVEATRPAPPRPLTLTRRELGQEPVQLASLPPLLPGSAL